MRYLYFASAFFIVLAIYITRSSDNISNNDLPKEVTSGYLLEENIISPNGEIDYYYFADPPMYAHLLGSMTCKGGTSETIDFIINETVPEKHPLKENDNMFVLESKISITMYDSEDFFKENIISTEVYNEEGALSLISSSDGTVCVAVESQAVPEIVRVGDSGRTATLKCSDGTQSEYSWSILKNNENIIARQTVRTDYDNLDSFDLWILDQTAKTMLIEGTLESGQCSIKVFGPWKSRWWDMKPSWKE